MPDPGTPRVPGTVVEYTRFLEFRHRRQQVAEEFARLSAAHAAHGGAPAPVTIEVRPRPSGYRPRNV